MKRIILLAVVLCGATAVYAQKYLTRTGKVTFFSKTSMENIEAINNETAAVFDGTTGDFIFQVPVKSFKFERALMEEHFNENYMESDKFPKADYKGKVTDMSKVDLGKDGTYNVNTKGKLNIHGVSKDVTLPGSVTVKGGEVTISAQFKIVPKDYGISIPGVVENKIAKEIEVTVNSILEKK